MTIKTTRSQAEIMAFIRELQNDQADIFGVMQSDLIDYLDYPEAKHFLKESVTEGMWHARENKTPREEIIGYLPFAWGKANDQRGLSANRSIQHFMAWAWLMNDDLYDRLHASYEHEYQHYGKPQLIMVSEHVSFDWQAVDDGERTNG